LYSAVSYPFSLKFTLLLSSRVRLCFARYNITLIFLIKYQFFHVCYNLCPSEASSFGHFSNIWRRVQIVKILIMTFYACSSGSPSCSLWLTYTTLACRDYIVTCTEFVRDL
jgi:hypothetical protein